MMPSTSSTAPGIGSPGSASARPRPGPSTFDNAPVSAAPRSAARDLDAERTLEMATSRRRTTPAEIGSPGTIPPVAQADGVTTAEDTAITFNVLADDSDANGDTLTIVRVTAASHGTLVGHGDGRLTYTPISRLPRS